jgi:hypothetical protein
VALGFRLGRDAVGGRQPRLDQAAGGWDQFLDAGRDGRVEAPDDREQRDVQREARQAEPDEPRDAPAPLPRARRGRPVYG